MKKRITAIILAGLLSFSGILPASTVPAKAADKPVVIVIDPGHGGNNLGAQHNGFTEKLLTLQVANAMKAELEKYDGVTVYLTRTTNEQGVSLEDRAAFAQSVNADFLYSLHFNASAEHNFYGCEVWTSAFGSCYQKGMDFGKIEVAELGSLDIYQKGVKTKIGKKGEPGADTRLVADPNAEPLWARFYDLLNCEPFVCDRDGMPRKHLSDIGPERRNGYSWYNDRPATLYKNYEKWKNKWDK